MATLNLFKDDAFSLMELTNALNLVPYKPQLLGSLNLFTPKPIRTLAAVYEKKEQSLSLVQTSERGAPLDQGTNEKRDIRYFPTHRLAKANRLRASEIQGIRAFGTESEFKQVQDETMDRLVRLRDDIDLTLEHMRLGAISGIVLDADGTVLDNWFTNWGFAQPAEIDFDLDNANPASGAVKKKCNDVIRTMARSSGGLWRPGAQVGALCGDAFYDDLTTHPEVVKTFLNQQAANELREGYANAFESFRYGGITWINYRGTDDGSTVSVGTDKAKFFPLNVADVFDWVQSPGESFDVVNQPGQPFYGMLIPDEKRNEHVDIEAYSYPLFVCTRPQMLLRGKRT